MCLCNPTIFVPFFIHSHTKYENESVWCFHSFFSPSFSWHFEFNAFIWSYKTRYFCVHVVSKVFVIMENSDAENKQTYRTKWIDDVISFNGIQMLSNRILFRKRWQNKTCDILFRRLFFVNIASSVSYLFEENFGCIFSSTFIRHTSGVMVFWRRDKQCENVNDTTHSIEYHAVTVINIDVKPWNTCERHRANTTNFRIHCVFRMGNNQHSFQGLFCPENSSEQKNLLQKSFACDAMRCNAGECESLLKIQKIPTCEMSHTIPRVLSMTHKHWGANKKNFE